MDITGICFGGFFLLILFVIGFVFLLAFGLMAALIIEMIICSGIEVVELDLPGWKLDKLMNLVIQHFQESDLEVYIYPNRVLAQKGETLLMGRRTFDIRGVETPAGCHLSGYFFLEGLFPKYMKFARRGYFGIIPRRMGWNIKKGLFEKLGYKIEDINNITHTVKSL